MLPATDVDHIVAGDDHEPSNLQALCRFHHARKSAREGASAAIKVRVKRERDVDSVGSMRQAMLDHMRQRDIDC
jgi:hypothetical protein